MNKEYNIKKLQKRIDKISKKYKNKKILLYGAGQFFQSVYKDLDFSQLNIIGICDTKYNNDEDKIFDNIPCYSPYILRTNKEYDVILVTLQNPNIVVPFIKNLTADKNVNIQLLIKSKKKTEFLKLFTDLFKKKGNKYNEYIFRLQNIEKKLSMPENIWQFNNTKIYVPYYPIDLIQRYIVNYNCYFEQNILQELDYYIPNDAVILDIGSNIGNHTLYWLLSSSKKISKIHCFEPVKDTFEILKKNIELNKLNDKVELHNVGLNDCKTKAEYKNYNRDNIGATHLKASETGEMQLMALDDIEFSDGHIDFIKIDVESMEVPLLLGAKNTIEKYKPKYIFIESEYNIKQVTKILNDYNYEVLAEYPQQNWLFELRG